MSEAALPPEERGTQRRYTLLNRFNINLPPGGKYILPGPENWRIDKTIQGMYLLLFRVEASDASDSVSNTGQNSVATGGVVGFSMPTLHYYVGNSNNLDINQITDIDATNFRPPMILRWKEVANAKLYRIDIEDPDGKKVFSSIVMPSTKDYQLPSFIRELASAKQLKWRISAIDEASKTLEESTFSEIN